MLSVPRMVISNVINFMAVARAWRLFIVHLVTGKRLAWDKTMHDFPSADGFVDRRQRLGFRLVFKPGIIVVLQFRAERQTQAVFDQGNFVLGKAAIQIQRSRYPDKS